MVGPDTERIICGIKHVMVLKIGGKLSEIASVSLSYSLTVENRVKELSSHVQESSSSTCFTMDL